jgi:peptidoglycan/LPS O-acetylase OafA/YrhL
MVSARGSFGWLTSFGSARPFWTLAIEVWIYLFVGAVVLLRRPTSADGSPASGLRYSPRALDAAVLDPLCAALDEQR